MENTPENNDKGVEKEAPSSESQNTDSDEKVLWVPRDKYLKFAYFLIMGASAFSILSSLLGLFDVGLFFSGIAGLAGVAGLAMALLGFFMFDSKFDDIEKSHFQHIGVVFVAFLVISYVIGSIFSADSLFHGLLMIILSVAYLGAIYIGYCIFDDGREATKDAALEEFHKLKARVGL